MPDILHELQIKTDATALRDAITTADGLAAFWTDQTEATPKQGTVATFGFGQPRDRVRDARRRADPRPGQWTCVGRPDEWVGTKLVWSLRPDGDATTLRFEHRDWKRDDGAVASCSYTWAMILERLGHYVVDGRVDPVFTKAGGVY